MKKKILLDYHKYLELLENNKNCESAADIPIQTGGFEEKISSEEGGEGEESLTPPQGPPPPPPPGEPREKEYRKLFDKKNNSTWLDTWEIFTAKKRC